MSANARLTSCPSQPRGSAAASAILLLCLLFTAHSDTADPLPTLPEEGRGVPVMGRVLWPEHDLANTQVRVYADAQRKRLVVSVPTGGPRGGIVFALDPGTYYLMAFSDQDGDSKASPGDGLGFYGVTGVGSSPRPLVIDPGSGVIAVSIPISFKIGEVGEDGRPRLEPVPVQAPAPYTTAEEARIAGQVTGLLGPDAQRFVLLIPLSPLYPPRAAFLGKDGKFELSAVPGAYQLIAIEDLNESNMIDCGDLIGVADYEASMGALLPALQAQANKELRPLEFDMRWALAKDGRLRSGDGAVIGPRVNIGSLPAICAGHVTRLGKPVPGAVVKVYADEALKQLHCALKSDHLGRFCLGVAPASYYLTAIHDANGDGATGPGDELGFFGLDESQLSARPQALGLQPGELRTDADIPLVMTLDEQSKPQPLATP